MFVRDCWKPRTEEESWLLIERYPWALLVNNGEEGPYATNLPLMLDRTKDRPVLVGHLAAANDHAQALRTVRTPSMAIFHGPASYVTASWYPNRDMPSTYYYTAVHCYGRVRIQSAEELRRSLEALTEQMEAQYPDGWKTSEVPARDIVRRLDYIMGFEIDVERIEGKFKLGQDEPKKDALAVARRLQDSTDTGQLELSRLVFEQNINRKES